jgi:hypothetical protein
VYFICCLNFFVDVDLKLLNTVETGKIVVYLIGRRRNFETIIGKINRILMVSV